MNLKNSQNYEQLCRVVREIGIREQLSGHVQKEWSMMRDHVSEALRDRTKMVLLVQDILPIVTFYSNRRNYPLAMMYDRGRNARLMLRVLKELV